MKFITLASACLVTGLAHGAALSEQVLAKASSEIKGNASLMLGWQLAGSSLNVDSLEKACENITWLGHGRWAAIGLQPENIKEPFCALQNSNPDPVTALTQINAAATDKFVAQVLHSFGDNTTSSFEWLCENFDYNAIHDQLSLDAYRISTAVCGTYTHSTGWTTDPIEIPPIPTSITADPYIYNKTSVVFSTLFAFSASTPTERWVMCEQYNYMAEFQMKEGLNSTMVREAICCNHDEPLMDHYWAEDVNSVMHTDIYLQQLSVAVGAINDTAKQDWLCENVEQGDLSFLGLVPGFFC